MERKEIWEEAPGEVWLWGFGEYPEHSVLAGLPRQVRLECYASVADAVSANPGLAVNKGRPARERAELPKEPPSWFDPMDAGEVWGEDDY